ncbi:hypothetical protein ACQ4PT_026573 [Festuca glaucescens]
MKKASSTKRDCSHMSSVITEVQRLGSLLPNVEFRKVARENNRLAHELARISRVSCSGGVLRGSAPPSVQELTLKYFIKTLPLTFQKKYVACLNYSSFDSSG